MVAVRVYYTHRFMRLPRFVAARKDKKLRHCKKKKSVCECERQRGLTRAGVWEVSYCGDGERESCCGEGGRVVSLVVTSIKMME